MGGKEKSETGPNAEESNQVQQKAVPDDGPAPSPSFPVVGIGSSAGGLEACEQLLSSLPASTGMAYVIITHLSPTHESSLSGILSKVSALPVIEVHKNLLIEPDKVYVIPPNADLLLSGDELKPLPRSSERGIHTPIDAFFQSLAVSKRNSAIGVILSGTGSDGVLGVQAIKSEGGIVLAQDPKTAKFAQMPENAVATGCVDFVLPPKAIAEELAHISRHPYVEDTKHPVAEATGESEEESFRKVLELLRTNFKVNFLDYKHSTLKRRILRRMMLRKINSLDAYVNILQEDESEIRELYGDVLINVTKFFRDPEVYQALKDTVFPTILKNREAEAPIRIWVTGCSTGQEVYSILICLMEVLGDMATNTPIQAFGTDLSERAIEKARAGLYPPSIAEEVSPERLRRFFVKLDAGYQISKTIRDMCVFAPQNVTADPPFSRLDLISCRNLLIYLGPQLQSRVLPLFHYALKPNGFLVLGTSETVTNFSELFGTVDKANKIYAKKNVSVRQRFDFPSGTLSRTKFPKVPEKPRVLPPVTAQQDIREQAERLFLARLAPTGVVTSEEGEIVQSFGDTKLYLSLSPGTASLSLFKMARREIALDLRTLLQRVKKEGKPRRKHGLRIRQNGDIHEVALDVSPLKPSDGGAQFYLVQFEEVAKTEAGRPPSKRSGKTREPKGARDERENRIRELERENSELKEALQAATDNLQATIEEHESTNEELRSANEEVLSSNEELQSTNEELETAKEELQSTNEELTTVNDELRSRNAELTTVNGDLTNLLASVRIPVVMLSSDLRVRRFTPLAEKLFKLIPTDIGRPISDIRPNINVPDLEGLLREVTRTEQNRELEAQDSDGHWYCMRLESYRTLDNRIDGAVLVLLDIHTPKTAERKFRGLLESAPDAMVIINTAQKVVLVNTQAERLFGYDRNEIVGRPVDTLIPERFRARHLEHVATFLKAPRTRRMGANLTGLFALRKDGNEFPVDISLSPIESDEGLLICAAIRDITDRNKAEEKLKETVNELTRSNEDLDKFASIVSHDLKEPLRMVEMFCKMIGQREPASVDKETREFLAYAQEGSVRMKRLIDGLLKYSRVGKKAAPFSQVDSGQIVRQALDNLLVLIRENDAKVEIGSLPILDGDPVQLLQLFQNLIGNAIRYRKPDIPPRISVTAEERAGGWEFRIGDNGIGINSEDYERIFAIFQRLNPRDKPEGEGVGLAVCRRIVENHEGRIWVESKPGDGSTFFFTLPRKIGPIARKEAAQQSIVARIPQLTPSVGGSPSGERKANP